MISESHPLHRLFRGLTESTFMTELGMGDPSLVGYVSNLLASFTPTQALGRIRDRQGRPLLEVARILAEAESAEDEERRGECHRHVGDFTLFWTGLYPDALRRLAGGDSADGLLDYQRQGKRSYYLASTMSARSDDRPVLRRLSEHFEVCAFGLAQVRKELDKLEADGASRADGRAIWA
ncbi:hypothetical protein [Paludisphaera rhizosphaerae]|uniref:hypothetical protein n=1 Tax=Paludisphaera rhizosphaerae TaxID=2711216 RepID=UPI0013EC150E|nr:hypothetical protein [Paludisphaera rhizosphaerae]